MFASRISSLRARLSARLARTLRVVGVTAAVLTSAACASDQLTAPATTHAATGAAQLAVTTTAATTTTQVKALLRTTPLAQNVTRSFTVRRNGGSGRYDWPEMGITVLVPDRSFPQRSITITVTALAGSVVAYEFGPEGQQFSEPLTIIQSLTRTNYTQAMRGTFRGAYFKSAADLNQLAGQATVSEFQPTTLDVQGNRVTFTVNHFSGYMVSMD